MKNFYCKVLMVLALLCVSLSGYSQKKKIEFGKGLRYTAKDSSFAVKFNFRFQNLMIVTYDGPDDNFTTQYLVRRSRLKFGGFVLNPNIEYKAEIGLTNRDISVNREDGNGSGASRLILDAVIKWKFTKNLAIWFGQTKLPGNRERVISSANLQFVDRSLVNSRFNIDRDVGIQLRGKFKLGQVLINPAFSFSQGEGRNITVNNIGGFDYTAHVDILPLGKFTNKGDYFGADLAREQKPKISFGFTFDYNDRAVRQGGQLGNFVIDSTGNNAAENTLTSFMADLIFKYKGFSVQSEYATRSAAKNIEGTTNLEGRETKFFTGSGFNIQAGYVFKNNIEPTLRYSIIRIDNEFSGLKDENELTIGLSKYIVGHALKIQTDFSRVTQPSVKDANYRFRFQVELQF